MLGRNLLRYTIVKTYIHVGNRDGDFHVNSDSGAVFAMFAKTYKNGYQLKLQLLHQKMLTHIENFIKTFDTSCTD